MLRSETVDSSLVGAAGPPAGMLEQPGQLALTGFTPLMDRIIYTVVEVLNPSLGYLSYGRIGTDSASGAILLQTGAPDTLQIGARFDTVNGTTNRSIRPPRRTPGMHVVWAQTSGGMTVAEVGADSALGSSLSIDPGDGMTEATINMPGPGSYMRPVTLLAYHGSHGVEQRTRVLAYLAQRYGVPLI